MTLALPPTNTDLVCYVRIYGNCAQYTEDGAEASCSENAAGGSSAFEDEAYGDVSLARNDSLQHFGDGIFPVIPPPTI